MPASWIAEESSPFFLFQLLTGVLRSEMLVGASAVGIGEKRGAVHASLFWSPCLLTPHFDLVRVFSFLAGGCRCFDLICGVLPSYSSSEELTPSLVVGCSPTAMTQPVGVSSCQGFAIIGGAFVGILPISQNHRVRRGDSLPARLFVVFPFENVQAWFVCENPFASLTPRERASATGLSLPGRCSNCSMNSCMSSFHLHKRFDDNVILVQLVSVALSVRRVTHRLAKSSRYRCNAETTANNSPSFAGNFCSAGERVLDSQAKGISFRSWVTKAPQATSDASVMRKTGLAGSKAARFIFLPIASFASLKAFLSSGVSFMLRFFAKRLVTCFIISDSHGTWSP